MFKITYIFASLSLIKVFTHFTEGTPYIDIKRKLVQKMSILYITAKFLKFKLHRFMLQFVKIQSTARLSTRTFSP